MLPPRLHPPLLLAICLASLSLFANPCVVGIAVAQPGPIQIRQLPDVVDTPAQPPADRLTPGQRPYPAPQMQSILEPPLQATRNADAPVEQIQKWVRELDADVFATRKAAAVELAAVGNRMVDPLVSEMTKRSSLEQRTRGFDILNELAISGNLQHESAAYEALRKLAGNEERALHRRAGQALVSIDKIYQGRALQKLEARGASIRKFGESQRFQRNPNGIVAREMVPGWLQIIFDQTWRGDADDLEMLRFVPDIRHIELKGAAVDDSFLAAIAHCKTLRVLRIYKTSITDKGLLELSEMPDLRELDVRYTKITETPLPELHTLKLTKIRFIGTRIPTTATALLASQYLGAEIDVRNGGFLGVSERLDGRDGCIINRPEANSAAEKAKLLQDDKIIKYDGKPVGSFRELRQFIAGNIFGDEITLTILRNGKEIERTVVLGEWPEDR